jgi:hypothetical protein
MIRTFPVCLALLWPLIGDSAFAQITGRITKVDDPGGVARAIERSALASSPSGVFGVLVHGTCGRLVEADRDATRLASRNPGRI